jgi:3-hydroxyisobutyrate dehydrogenase-like beta-hydroxyacid dehydrogenase
MKVGLIGLGRMGQGMGQRLLGGGHDLVVFNRTAGKAADLEKAGAKTASTVAAACTDRDIVISMVSDDAALNEVALGAGASGNRCPGAAFTWRWAPIAPRRFRRSRPRMPRAARR